MLAYADAGQTILPARGAFERPSDGPTESIAMVFPIRNVLSEPDPVETGVGSPARVLVAEDDDGMRDAIEALLEAAGIEVVAYASAEALLAGGAVDGARCVICDLKLPAMSGFELLTILGTRGDRLPLILITAHDEPGVRREAARRGAAAFLTKPFAGNDLLEAIETAVRSWALK
jgi:FixJ family two-component response regulator